MRVVLVVVCLITSIAAHAQARPEVITGDMYLFPEPILLPQFPGGESSMAHLIRKIFRYPKRYPRVEVSGFVQFVVEEDGYVGSVKTIKSVHPLVDAETERVIRMLPPWTPGKQGGKDVAVTMVLSLSFSGRDLAEPIEVFPYQEDDIYSIVEIMPEYPGGSGKMSEFISRNIKFPQSNSVTTTGKIFVGFVVEKDGSISNVKIERGVGSPLEEEAMRVVRAFPKWVPGKHEGKNVRVKMIIPFTICLKE